jgi:hypothetical protein
VSDRFRKTDLNVSRFWNGAGAWLIFSQSRQQLNFSRTVSITFHRRGHWKSRAVDDRDRSSSSSDPGSAIEGFRQKITLHHQLTDLGMTPRQLGGAVPARAR